MSWEITLNKIPVKMLLLAVVIMTGNQGIAGNTHYRWLNDRGEPVYSDRPPPQGVEYEVISTSSSFKRAVSADEGAVPLETESRVGNEFEQIDTAEQKRQKKNPELCQRARTNLEALTSSDQVKIRNDQGEIRLLTPEEMQIQRVTAEEQVRVYCD
jgi:hypothetical protein